MQAVTREAFHAALRGEENVRNAGTTTRFDATENVTFWLVAGEVVGKSEGSLGTQGAYYLTVELQ